MNDLAEMALDTLGAVRRACSEHAVLCLGAAGFVVGTVAVLAGGQASATRADVPLTTWLGIQDTYFTQSGGPAGALWLAAIGLLALAWVGLVRVTRLRATPARRVWAVAGVWALPFLAGPPLSDTGVYADVAFGRLLHDGLNPYVVGPARLGETSLVLAISPADRTQPTAAGPLGTFAAHLSLAIAGGSALLAVLVLRGMCVAAMLWIGRSSADLAAPGDSGAAVAASVANPLALLFAVNTAHLDVVMVGCLLAALVQARQRRWSLAVFLAAVGGSVTPVGLVAVPLLIAGHWASRRGRPRRAVLARESGIAAVTIAAAGFVQPHGFDWVRSAWHQFTPETPFSIAGGAQELLGVMVRAASYDDLAAGARLTAAFAALCVVVYLLVTARHRSLGAGLGYALLALGLLAPVLYPWYLLWGALCLLPRATGQLRIVLCAISVGGCVLIPLGFSTRASNLITGVGLAAIGIAALVALRMARGRPATGSGRDGAPEGDGGTKAAGTCDTPEKGEGDGTDGGPSATAPVTRPAASAVSADG